jgi:DNA-binding response OmpR family regulator
VKALSLLVVEDSPTQAARLQYVLSQAGHQVQLATGARTALELAQDLAFDLVVSDVTMPDIDGFTLCRLVKENPTTSHLPVLLLTGLSDPSDIVRGLEAGADSYLTKPYSDQDLLARIQFVVDNRHPERHLSAEPLAVNFLGKTHVIKSSREQMLGLLLSTYESAARQNKTLIKDQLNLRMQLREMEAAADDPSASSQQVDMVAKLQSQLEDYRSQLEFLEEIVTDADAARDNSEDSLKEERAERERVELQLLETQTLQARLAELSLQNQALTRQVDNLQEEQSDLLGILDQTESEQMRLREEHRLLADASRAAQAAQAAAEALNGGLNWNLALQEERIVDLERRLGETAEQLSMASSTVSLRPVDWMIENWPTGVALQGALGNFVTVGLPELANPELEESFELVLACGTPEPESQECKTGRRKKRRR